MVAQHLPTIFLFFCAPSLQRRRGNGQLGIQGRSGERGWPSPPLANRRGDFCAFHERAPFSLPSAVFSCSLILAVPPKVCRWCRWCPVPALDLRHYASECSKIGASSERGNGLACVRPSPNRLLVSACLAAGYSRPRASQWRAAHSLLSIVSLPF